MIRALIHVIILAFAAIWRGDRVHTIRFPDGDEVDVLVLRRRPTPPPAHVNCLCVMAPPCPAVPCPPGCACHQPHPWGAGA